MAQWMAFTFACFFISQALALSTPLRSYSHSQAQLVASVNELKAGDSAYVGLWIKLKPHWHSYWENPGDSGATPILKWHNSHGTLSPILWPTPERVETSGLQTFGYSGEVFLLQKFTLPDTSKIGEKIHLRLDAEWLVCDEICVPQSDHFELEIGVGGKTSLDETLLPYITESLRREPLANPLLRYSYHDEKLRVTSVGGDFEPLDFFANLHVPVNAQKPKLEKVHAKEWNLLFQKEVLSTSSDRFSGVLIYKQDGQTLSAPVVISQNVWDRVFVVLGFVLWAFLGGLILNLMPCVLPVLMLKAFSLLKNSQSSLTTVRKESALYTLGVLLSLWILSGLIVILQNAGRLVGWGFQLQSPYFNLFLIFVFVALALNLLGVFDIQVVIPRRFQKYLRMEGSTGALATGLLSVIVASPCTAPFMGVAIGFALAQSLGIIFLIFTSLGLGLAFPYLLIAFFPQTVRFLPKPGAWMETFKKILAVPLLLTALWLGWVFAQQIQSTKQTVSENGLVWKNFSDEEVEKLRGQKAFFIDFTADWCLSCKVNERLVFGNKEVLAELRKSPLILIRADWTNYDPKITEWLKKYQRAGVPFYIMVHADGREELLPELLTPGVFLNSLKKLE